MRSGLVIVMFALVILGFQQNQTILRQEEELRSLKASTEPLVPDLGVQMSIIQSHHAKLFFAGSRGNWELAEYQLDELQEMLNDATHLHHHYKKLSADLDDLRGLIKGSSLELEASIQSKSMSRFRDSFAHLTQACNTCHQAAEHPYIVIQEPESGLFTNQNFNVPEAKRALASTLKPKSAHNSESGE